MYHLVNFTRIYGYKCVHTAVGESILKHLNTYTHTKEVHSNQGTLIRLNQADSSLWNWVLPWRAPGGVSGKTVG